MQLQEHLLSEIVGGIACAEHAQCEAMNRSLMQAHQCRERGVIAGSRTG
jgi:hypothetical protein